MRRALENIVPRDVLNRPIKATIARAPLAAIAETWPKLIDLTQDMASASLGFVNSEKFRSALERARHGEEPDWLRLTRTIHIERWLRKLLASGFVELENRVGEIEFTHLPPRVRSLPAKFIFHRSGE
jgi:hypothetical protein